MEPDVMVDRSYSMCKALQTGHAIHADARRKGYHSDVFVGSTLISMYGKLGSILDAWNVFEGLPQKNVVSWNAMLAAYAYQGQTEKVMQLYHEMCERSLTLDERTFVCALQACGMLAETDGVDHLSHRTRILDMGRSIHADVQKRGYHHDIFVGSTLVSMYGKCGAITDAEMVFSGLSQRNAVSWNAMLSAYVEQEEAEKAWQLYGKMREGEICPSHQTLVSMLQVCGSLAENEGDVEVGGQAIKVQALEKLKAIHADIRGTDYNSDVVSGFLVCMYNKCGDILGAQMVFDGLPQPNLMAWSSVLESTVVQQRVDKTLELYAQMLEQGARPFVQTIVVVLQACSILAEEEDWVDGLRVKVKSLVMGKAVHADAWREGLHTHVFVCSTLISLYGKCGSIADAENVFAELLERDVVAWTAMLVACCQHGYAETALGLYEQMQEECVSPDVLTLVSALQACGTVAKNEANLSNGQQWNVKTLGKGKAIHADACRRAYAADLYVCTALISMYGKCGSLPDAQNVFDGLPQRNVVAWTAMLGAYLEQGQGEKALQLYRHMDKEGVTLDDIAIVSILQACSSTGCLDLCRQIHQNFAFTGKKLTSPLANTLIHAYGRCASMADAQQVFDMLPQPDVVSCNALMAGYGRQGDGAASMRCYKDMGMLGVKPDGATFLSLLSTCSHSGLLDTGVEFFQSMSRDHGITPSIEHYVCMVDLLGRAGNFRVLRSLLSTMPMQPNLAMCLCLLSACRRHGKVTLGRQAFDMAVRLAPDHTAAYLLMSNVYAEAGRQTCADEVIDSRKQAGAWKEPGCSTVRHDQGVQMFLVGDCTHPNQELIYDLLGKVRTDVTAATAFAKVNAMQIRSATEL